ncbi:hypothetical protein FKM82_029362 [Ascaphus truei]
MVDSMTARFPGPVAAKTSPNHHPSTTVLDSWYEVFVLICCVWFSPNVALCIMTKHLHFGLVCPKDIVPEVLWFVQMQLCKHKPCCHFLFREKRLSPGNPSKQTILVQSFSHCTVMNFNI